MSKEPTNSVDVLGLKSYGDAVNTAVKGTLEGAGAFLSRVCLPVAEELGLLFRDRVSHWRAIQAAKITEKAERKLRDVSGSETWYAHPRVVGRVVETGSWVDADDVQDMWAGLLASACTPDGKDEANIMFIEMLSQLTASEALIFRYACEAARKRVTDLGTVKSDEVIITLKQLIEVTGIEDVFRLDRELDHLRNIGLLDIMSGLTAQLSARETEPYGNITPSDLGIQMYVRCQGSRLTPVEYFKVTDSLANET